MFVRYALGPLSLLWKIWHAKHSSKIMNLLICLSFNYLISERLSIPWKPIQNTRAMRHDPCPLPQGRISGDVSIWRGSNVQFQGRRLGDSYLCSALSFEFQATGLWGMTIALITNAMRPEGMGVKFHPMFPSSAETTVSLINQTTPREKKIKHTNLGFR